MTVDPAPEVVVLRCDACGDVFPVRDRAPAVCPSCGSTELVEAAEPLL